MPWHDTPCIESTVGINQGGYSQRRVNGRRIMAHRHAWEQTHGPIPDGLIVCHHCDNPPCMNTEHLFLGTHLDNVRDMVAKNRQRGATGENNSHAKLTRQQVNEIRFIYAEGGVTQRALAKAFGISYSQLRNIITGQQWCNDGTQEQPA